jgi:hypothetical protein
MRTALPLRRLALSLAVPAVALAAAGCDTYQDTNDDTYGNVIDVVTFSFDVDELDVINDGYTASFSSDDVANRTAGELIEEILDDPDVTEDGVVLLYAEDDLILGTASGDITRWAALPYTEGFEEEVVAGQPYVDFTLTYSYSYDAGDPSTSDDGNLYFDITSSAQNLDVGTFLEQRLEDDTAAQFRMKLVAIPATLFTESGLRAGDLRDYATVARAFDLAAE